MPRRRYWRRCYPVEIEDWLRERLAEAMTEEVESKSSDEPDESESDDGDDPNVYPLW